MLAVFNKFSQVLKIFLMDIIGYNPVAVTVFKIVVILVADMFLADGSLGKGGLYLLVFIYHVFDAADLPRNRTCQ